MRNNFNFKTVRKHNGSVLQDSFINYQEKSEGSKLYFKVDAEENVTLSTLLIQGTSAYFLFYFDLQCDSRKYF